jgi:hypothetical protein
MWRGKTRTLGRLELIGRTLAFLMLASPLIAVCCAALVYASYSDRFDPRHRRPLAFIAGVALFGVGFVILGTIVGTGSICMVRQSAQCGLIAPFIAAVSFAFGVVFYVPFWVRNARKTP